MTNVAGKDDNDFPIIWGVSDVDGITPVQVKFNATTRGMLIDTVTSISFTASVNTNQNSTDYPFAKATAATTTGAFTANTTTRPWVVNHSTGAVLVTFS